MAEHEAEGQARGPEAPVDCWRGRGTCLAQTTEETLVETARTGARPEAGRLHGKKTAGHQTPPGTAPAGALRLYAVPGDPSSGRLAQVLWRLSTMLRLQRSRRRRTLAPKPTLKGKRNG